MKFQIYVISLLSIVFFSGCMGSFLAKPSIKQEIGSDIGINQRKTVFSGNIILNSYNYSQIKGIRIMEDVSEKFILGNVIFKEGDFLRKYINDTTDEYYFCGNNYQAFGKSERSGEICLIEEYNEVGKFLKLFKNKGSKSSYYSGPYTLNNILSYEKATQKDTTKEFKKIELIFDGIQHGMLLLTYNEYLESPKRPSYSRQMVFSINHSKSTDIVYKSAKIRVYKATKNKIVYKIIKPLVLDTSMDY